jgi:hypothetical protein
MCEINHFTLNFNGNFPIVWYTVSSALKENILRGFCWVQIYLRQAVVNCVVGLYACVTLSLTETACIQQNTNLIGDKECIQNLVGKPEETF